MRATRFRIQGFRPPILSLITASSLSACAAAPAPCASIAAPPKIVDTACSWVRPLSASAADTDATKREILAHDLAWRANCAKPATRTP